MKNRWVPIDPRVGHSPMTRDSLARTLRTNEHAVRSFGDRVVPTAFDAHDELLTAFPRHSSSRWVTAESIFERNRGACVLLRLPLFWQSEIPLHDACARTGTFLFVNDRRNMPLAAAALTSSSVKVVVTDAKDANDLATFLLVEGHDFPKEWLVVQRADEWVRLSAALTGASCEVTQEVHVMPSVPILFQCRQLAVSPFSFHVSEGFHFECGERSYISGHTDDPLPLVRFELPFTSRILGTCGCGAETIELSPQAHQ